MMSDGGGNHTPFGADEAGGVVMLHGFMGSSADWGEVRAALGDVPVWTPELPGHGAEPVPPEPLALDALADRVAGQLGDRFDAPPVLVGYSLGGRLALRIAARHRETIAALVLISTHPGLEAEFQRRERAALDDRRAAQLAQDYEGFLRRWYSGAPFSLGGAALEAAIARRVGNDPHAMGRVIRELSPGRQPPSWEVLGTVPTVAVFGANDRRYRELAPRVAGAIGTHGRVFLLPEVSHSIPTDAGRDVGLLIRRQT